jgi:hypothetical protein
MKNGRFLGVTKNKMTDVSGGHGGAFRLRGGGRLLRMRNARPYRFCHFSKNQHW